MRITRSSIVAGLGAGAVTLSFTSPNAHADADVVETDRVPTVYVVPMSGQMGTDINEVQMADVIDDVLKQETQPDLVVLKIKSADLGTNYHLPQDDPNEFGMIKLEEYRAMVRDFHNRLPDDIRQVVWVEDSVGFASLLALSWPEMYMSPEGRLWGLSGLFTMSQNWSDADVREKMEEAWEGIGRGFLEMGGHGEAVRELGSAMMDPSKVLSADFKGRNVVWRGDTAGTWLIDNSDESVATFDARTAEDTLLSDGIVESLDDLMFLLGYREYETNDSGEEMIDRYHSQWRRAYKDSLDNLADIRQGRGGGSDQLKQLLNQKRQWEEILRNMRRFNAVERRLEREAGINKDSIELLIDQINDQIRQVKDNRRRNGGGRSGGGNRYGTPG